MKSTYLSFWFFEFSVFSALYTLVLFFVLLSTLLYFIFFSLLLGLLSPSLVAASWLYTSPFDVSSFSLLCSLLSFLATFSLSFFSIFATNLILMRLVMTDEAMVRVWSGGVSV
jgi:hypothetical protein